MIKLLASLPHTSKLSVTLLLFSGLLSGCGKSSEAEFQKFVQQQNCITTAEIVRSFETIKERTNTLFSQFNRVCGIVSDINLTYDAPFIALEAPGWKGIVQVGDVDKASAASMSKGDFAVFECGAISTAYSYPFLLGCRGAYISISHDASQSEPPVGDWVAGDRQPSNFKAANDNALIIGREFASGGGEAAWARFDAAFGEVSTFSKKGVPFCNLEVTAYVSYSVPCGYQQNYLYIFTQGLQGIPF